MFGGTAESRERKEMFGGTAESRERKELFGGTAGRRTVHEADVHPAAHEIGGVVHVAAVTWVGSCLALYQLVVVVRVDEVPAPSVDVYHRPHQLPDHCTAPVPGPSIPRSLYCICARPISSLIIVLHLRRPHQLPHQCTASAPGPGGSLTNVLHLRPALSDPSSMYRTCARPRRLPHR
jgi:hypothetical protein